MLNVPALIRHRNESTNREEIAFYTDRLRTGEPWCEISATDHCAAVSGMNFLWSLQILEIRDESRKFGPKTTCYGN